MLHAIPSQFVQNELDSASDEQLLIWYRDQGMVPAFEALLHRYEKPLLGFLTHYLHSAAQAEDILQTTFLHVLQRCDSFLDTGRVRPWLYSIATHLAIDALRSEHRHPITSLDSTCTDECHDGKALVNLLQMTSPSPLEELESRERAEWIRMRVASLPDPLRVVVLLIYFQGLKFHEVAEALRLPLGTVKTRVHKALLTLQGDWRRQNERHGKNPASTEIPSS